MEETVEHSWPPGLDPADFGDRDPGPFEYEPDFPEKPSWRCLRCDGTSYGQDGPNSWLCYTCGSTFFYDYTAPTRQEAESGTWVYEYDTFFFDVLCFFRFHFDFGSLQASENPDGTFIHGNTGCDFARLCSSRRGPSQCTFPRTFPRRKGRVRDRKEDQSVDLETLQPLPRPSRRQRRAAAAAGHGGRGQGQRSPGHPGTVLLAPLALLEDMIHLFQAEMPAGATKC